MFYVEVEQKVIVCHFDKRSEEKSPHSIQKEISHSPRRIRNDNPELFG